MNDVNERKLFVVHSQTLIMVLYGHRRLSAYLVALGICSWYFALRNRGPLLRCSANVSGHVLRLGLSRSMLSIRDRGGTAC